MASRCQFDKVFVPDPADLVCRVILIFGEPELAVFANDIEDLVIVSQWLYKIGYGSQLTSPAT